MVVYSRMGSFFAASSSSEVVTIYRCAYVSFGDKEKARSTAKLAVLEMFRTHELRDVCLHAPQKTDQCFLIESGEVVCTTHLHQDHNQRAKEEGEVLKDAHTLSFLVVGSCGGSLLVWKR